MRAAHPIVLMSLLAPVLCVQNATAEDRFEQPPISYSETEPNDIVTQLQDAITAGEMSLAHDDEFGYLKAVLDALDIPYDSQVLVFSKTSFQADRITPETPRAVYFNDDFYVGTVQHGDVLEISTADPDLGAVFYTLSQREVSRPQFIRQDHNCLQCHASTLTGGSPGHILRSVYPDARGFPILKAGTRLTTSESPFEERWGGWYVTGTHGNARHMGNMIAEELEYDARIDMDLGANHEVLDPRVDASKYLTPHSDIVALLVLAHQVHVHNLITNANFETHYALKDQAVMDEILERDPNVLSDSTQRRIAGAGDDLLDAILFANEVPLTDPIQGTSNYAATFADAGPRDRQGRSLRELDLNDRLFTYPLSYLVYSPQFTGLPSQMKDYLYRRLWDVLTAPDTSEFPHLTLDQRQAIREILIETSIDLPDNWK